MKTLALVPVDLSKLSGVVKNNAAKKTVHEKLVAKENNIDSGLVKKLDYNPKVTETENKIPTISINCSGKYIPNISVLVKKKKQIITQKILKLKRNLSIILIINILLPQSVRSLQQKFWMQD